MMLSPMGRYWLAQACGFVAVLLLSCALAYIEVHLS